MNKSMYSLILMDDVVRAIDRVAYEKGTSRSSLINRILAEYASIVTPDMLIRQIFDVVSAETAANKGLRLQQEPSASMLSMNSVVNYKYNPTIRYCVEIMPESGGYIAEFRVLSRSQSDALLDLLTDFFLLWSQMEQMVLSGQVPPEALQHEVGGGRFCRKLRVADGSQIYDCQQLGESIARYINLFNAGMNLYFDNPAAFEGPVQKAAAPLLELYREYVNSCELIV